MSRLIPIFVGGALTIVSAMAMGYLAFPRTVLPAAVRFVNGGVLFSCSVFVLLGCGVGYAPAFLVLSGLLVSLVIRIHSRLGTAPLRTQRVPRLGSIPWLVRTFPGTPPLPRMHWYFRLILAAYGLLYLIYALAPEIQPDAFGYHLRLVSEYVRLAAFSSRIGFYDMLPQGMEMLFVPAFALGGASAAKLVHLGALCATVPLIREIARESGLTDRIGSVAAVLFFLAPVCGVAGTAAYTDAGLVCASCALLYLLLRWERDRSSALLLCAGLNAGFCYTVKPTFGWVALAGVAFVVVRARRIVPAFAFAAMALLIASPWMARAIWFTGNPVTPFLSDWFPNPVSTPELERALTARFSAWRSGFSWRTAFLDYTVAGGNTGLLGAGFLLIPLALFSLRRKTGRWLLGSAVLLAVPVALNTGTRFLLPAMAPAAIALAAVLPAPMGFAVVGLQAVASAPPVMNLYDRKYEWRLGPLPLRAALGLTSEDSYLRQTVPGFEVTDLVNRNTRSDARILTLASVPEAYIPRELLVYWESAAARNFTDALEFARMSQGTRARLLSWRWKCGEYSELRFTALSEVRMVEAHLRNGESAAQTWKAMSPGGSVSIQASGAVTGADLLIWPGDQAQERTEALGVSGAWKPIGLSAERVPHIVDLRRDASAYVRRSGYRYILTPVAGDAFAELGADLMRHSSEWGLEAVGHAGNMWLFYILPDLM